MREPLATLPLVLTTPEVLTERLVLTPAGTPDVPELHALHADPAVWGHFPSGRHTDVEQTDALVRQVVAGWQEHGLDYWAVRLRGPEQAQAQARGEGIVGIGGVSLRKGAAWNLYYRLAPEAWGRGLAQEVVAAARDAAARVRPDLPVVAFLLEHNGRSRRAAERAGFTLAWRGPDAGNPNRAAVRLVYADRPLPLETLRLFVDAT